MWRKYAAGKMCVEDVYPTSSCSRGGEGSSGRGNGSGGGNTGSKVRSVTAGQVNGRGLGYDWWHVMVT